MSLTQYGLEAWFDVDDITIRIWASSWIGREIVTIRVDGRERVVSDRYNWRFRCRSPGSWAPAWVPASRCC